MDANEIRERLKAAIKKLPIYELPSARQVQKKRRQDLLRTRGRHTNKEWRECKIKHGYKCYWQISPRCRVNLTDDTAVREHVIPISKGGSNRISNIVPSCCFCNSKKGAKILTR